MKEVKLAAAEDLKLLAGATQQYHEPLQAAEARIGLVMVSCDDGPAITHAGAQALAKVRRLNARDRLLTGFDAVIEVDAAVWESFTREQRIALLDHELTHLAVEKTGGGRPRHYPDGRPKLATRPDDWMITGFYEVVERHGEHAPDAAAISAVIKQGQHLFPFAIESRKEPRPRIIKAKQA